MFKFGRLVSSKIIGFKILVKSELKAQNGYLDILIDIYFTTRFFLSINLRLLYQDNKQAHTNLLKKTKRNELLELL